MAVIIIKPPQKVDFPSNSGYTVNMCSILLGLCNAIRLEKFSFIPTRNRNLSNEIMAWYNGKVQCTLDIVATLGQD